MKTCKRLLDFVQIINAEGDVRLCGWNHNNTVGNLLQEDFIDIMRGNKARKLRQMIAEGDYSYCPADNCPYIANDNLDDVLVEYSEDEIGYPESLLLAYEGNCNYNCTCCTSFQHMADTKCHDYKNYYDRLEEKILPLLPHLKHIGANGRGELFASPRTLKLLGQWEPIAPAEDVSVTLETNGSLFNERNWEKIKNLGRYNLNVAITVMSFDELTYQYLSGTNQPISMLIDSLDFVKGLREKNIINYLELATVMQELNFREMPVFVRKCLEEFGADNVRIRPIMRGGPKSENVQWFEDVRNPNHPHYSLFRKVMSNPIFKHPKVLMWSGNLDSEHGEMPIAALNRKKEILSLIEKIVKDDNFSERLQEKASGEQIALYGLGTIGRSVVAQLRDVIDLIIDEMCDIEFYDGVKVVDASVIKDYKGIIITTPYGREEELKHYIREKGFMGKILSLKECL